MEAKTDPGRTAHDAPDSHRVVPENIVSVLLYLCLNISKREQQK